MNMRCGEDELRLRTMAVGWLRAWVVGVLFFIGAGVGSDEAGRTSASRSLTLATSLGAAETTGQPSLRNYAAQPMMFEANAGQTDARVDFLSRGRGYTLFLARNEAIGS